MRPIESSIAAMHCHHTDFEIDGASSWCDLNCRRPAGRSFAWSVVMMLKSRLTDFDQHLHLIYFEFISPNAIHPKTHVQTDNIFDQLSRGREWQKGEGRGLLVIHIHYPLWFQSPENSVWKRKTSFVQWKNCYNSFNQSTGSNNFINFIFFTFEIFFVKWSFQFQLRYTREKKL